jgi:hypothetical protein
MRLWVISDLHLEFGAGGIEPPAGVEAVVAAGGHWGGAGGGEVVKEFGAVAGGVCGGES